MDKEQEKILRDFNISFCELVANIENCEKLCPTDGLMEMCETLAGIMAEQTAIIETLEGLSSEKEWNKVRNEFRRPLVGERFYSSHLDTLCDMMRLAKHLKDVSKSKGELLTSLKRLEGFPVLPQLDVKHIRWTIEAIPRVKTLNNGE